MINEKDVQSAVREFEKALRYMARARRVLDAFTLGKVRDGQEYSILLLIAPTPDVNATMAKYGYIETVDLSAPDRASETEHRPTDHR